MPRRSVFRYVAIGAVLPTGFVVFRLEDGSEERCAEMACKRDFELLG